MLFGQKHVERYQATDGEEGHEWQPGVLTLLLTTTGRKSGEDRTTPLIYGEHGDDPVVVASNGGMAPPAWFLNLEEEPHVDVQILGEKFGATARVASPEEKEELWPQMTEVWPAYDDYQEKATREIPIVILERA